MSTDTKYPILIYTNNRDCIDDQWFLHNDQLQDIVNSFPSDSSFKNFVDHYTVFENDHALFQQAFLTIVTETVYNYPTIFSSEKTFRPILNKRPFVIVGAPGSIKKLQDLGFLTFGDFWNEDYDGILDPEKRLLSVFEIVKSVYNKSIEELQILCNDMGDILEHNFNLYINDFKPAQLKKFEEACIENLKPRHD